MIRAILFLLITGLSLPTYSELKDYDGSWVGAGGGTFGHLTGEKSIYSEAGYTFADMFMTNGEVDYTSSMICIRSRCDYQDSSGLLREYVVRELRDGSLTFSWSHGEDVELITWTPMRFNAFTEQYRAKLDGVRRIFDLAHFRKNDQ